MLKEAVSQGDRCKGGGRKGNGKLKHVKSEMQ